MKDLKKIITAEYNASIYGGKANAWQKIPDQDKIESNIQVLDRFAVQWDTLIETGDNSDYIKLFMHIPKTGGTSFENIVAKNYTINTILHSNAPALEKNPNMLFAKKRYPQVVLGHYKLFNLVYQDIDRPVVHMTLLRDPVHRILSYYNYLKTTESHPLYDSVWPMSFQDYIESDRFVELHNAQTLRITGLLRHKRIKSNDYDRESTLQFAKEMLKNRFSIIGITEHFPAFLVMLQKVLGWRDIYSEKRNVSKKIVELKELDKKLVEKIRRKNDLDVELYNFGNDLFQQRCIQLGIDETSIERYNTRNKSYSELLSAPIV